jgi:hypothetical protein
MQNFLLYVHGELIFSIGVDGESAEVIELASPRFFVAADFDD